MFTPCPGCRIPAALAIALQVCLLIAVNIICIKGRELAGCGAIKRISVSWWRPFAVACRHVGIFALPVFAK